jgi:protein-tyrosine kinase
VQTSAVAMVAISKWPSKCDTGLFEKLAMSRFYQALKAANLESHTDCDALTPEEPMDRTAFEDFAAALGRVDRVEGAYTFDAVVTSVLDQSDQEPSGPGKPVAAFPATAGETPEIGGGPTLEDEVRTDAPKTDSQRCTISVSLDRTVRVLPHVADRNVLERYRRLRTQIIQQQEANPFRTLLVTSASPHEGKTVTVLNLGLSFGMIPDFKVLVIDGDLRRGAVGKWLGVESRPGLSDLIKGAAGLDDVILRCGNLPIDVVVSGNSKVPPGELLQSKQLRGHFRSMAERYSLVLVDSPPVNMFTDTHLLAASCDAVLLVARAYSSTRKLVQKAAQDLASHRMIGAVLNGATTGNLERRSYGY